MRTTKTLFAVSLAGLQIAAGTVAKADQKGTLINQIIISGNKRINKDAIMARHDLKIGQVYTEKDLDESLKRLYRTEWFDHVSIKADKGSIHISVTENPTVNQVALEGNKEISDEILKAEIKTKPLEVFTNTRIKNDTKRLYDLYRLKGHFAATVTPKVIKREQNRVDVVFEIQEGEATHVSKIFFIGNKHFGESKLESILQTKESRWYRFFTTDDNYDPDRIAYDRELLRKFYLEHGYADFRIKSVVAELTSDQKEFFITFTIEEGERYVFDKTTVKSEIPDIDEKALSALLTTQEGDWYSSKLVEKNVTLLTDALGNKGYAFVDVEPVLDKDQKNKKVKLSFKIQEGPRVYINQIKISGNIRTDEDVIRREFRFHEGDAFNTSRLKESERRIKNLGYFKDVKIKREPTLDPDKVDIIVEVDEERTGEVSLGAGFSTTDGPLADVRFNESNFRGRGQQFGIGFTLAKRRNDFNISFTEPYFMKRELALGVELFRSQQKNQQNVSYGYKSYGVTLKMGYRLTENLRHSLYYGLRRDEVGSVDNDASVFVKKQVGKHTMSVVGHDFLYDRTDNIINSTEGYRLGFGNDLAGLGGSVKFLKTRGSGAYFYPVSDDCVFSFSGEGGVLNRLGKDVRIIDRFSLGGDSFRGFEPNGLGPRDKAKGDSLNGKYYYVGTTEVIFPLGLPNEFGIKGAVFCDFGSVWNSGEPRNLIFDGHAIRASAGFELRWKSPMGPIKIGFTPFAKKQPYDKRQVMHFGYSTRF